MSFQEAIRNKKNREKIVMLTAYDYQMARILEDTKSVTMEDMIFHVKAVARGARAKPIIGDMPINSCDTTETCLENAQRFRGAGAHGIKIEGRRTQAIKALIEEGIPVMGHVGMLPQAAEAYNVKGKTPQEAEQILMDSLELDRLGVFSIVLECIPQNLAKTITESVSAPTIGIGAGRYCDGQVLVLNDLLGLNENFKPKYVKTYMNLNQATKVAVTQFIREVSAGEYPDEEHTYH
jgi:3-methyl-2-oxobutanoate hydroxymethyltransferase